MVRISRESGPSGSAATASPRLAVRPSLLPNNTSHDGPPALKDTNIIFFKNIYIYIYIYIYVIYNIVFSLFYYSVFIVF